ncbi:ankyrin [Pleomassaria siparia CBS 279.74]|uniref:Ankyrin n=1 Tax=Pleomassaria siparia CBS 279.74 TaxID=1314801 RepID=A0A6G1JUA8_9PLEO|nr:ankyrin [Pleomassaria siparia CBS 279.74]
MQFLQLPLEVQHDIFYHAIVCRGLKRGLRLRLVNKVIQVLYASRLLDVYLSTPPWPGLPQPEPPQPAFTASYLAYRVLNEPDNGVLPLLRLIRKVAEQLIDENSSNPEAKEEETRACIESLCAYVVSRPRRSFSIPFSMKAHDLEQKIKIDAAEWGFDSHLLVAAVYMNFVPTVKRLLVALGDNVNLNDAPFCWLFGHATHAAADQGLINMLKLVGRAAPDYLIMCAAKNGHLEAVKYLFELYSKYETDGFDEPKTKDRRMESLVQRLETPNMHVYDFIMDLRQRTERFDDPIDGLPSERCFLRSSQDYLNGRLRTCAQNGWTKMARLYLLHGASGETPAYKLPKGVLRIILEACKYGHLDIVQLMIEHGADSHACVEVAAKYGHEHIVRWLLDQGAETGEAIEEAAASGFGAIVKMLLDYDSGIQVLEIPLVSAIRLEHTAMFELLLERSEPLTDEVAGQLVKTARAEGLDSMIALLDKYGVNVKQAGVEDMEVLMRGISLSG